MTKSVPRDEGSRWTIDAAALHLHVSVKRLRNVLSARRSEFDDATYERFGRLVRVLSERDMERLRVIFPLRVKQKLSIP